MNQRVSRKSKKDNRVDHISVATGGWTARQSTDGKSTEVNVEPEKNPTAPERGLAKASPAFRSIKPKFLKSVDDEKKAIAENVVEKNDKEDQEKE